MSHIGERERHHLDPLTAIGTVVMFAQWQCAAFSKKNKIVINKLASVVENKKRHYKSILQFKMLIFIIRE